MVNHSQATSTHAAVNDAANCLLASRCKEGAAPAGGGWWGAAGRCGGGRGGSGAAWDAYTGLCGDWWIAAAGGYAAAAPHDDDVRGDHASAEEYVAVLDAGADDIGVSEGCACM